MGLFPKGIKEYQDKYIAKLHPEDNLLNVPKQILTKIDYISLKTQMAVFPFVNGRKIF